MEIRNTLLIFKLLFFKSLVLFSQPTAKIISDDVSFCESGATTLEVELSGEQPFKITYKFTGREGHFYTYEVPLDENPAKVNIDVPYVDDTNNLPQNYKVELIEVWDKTIDSGSNGSTLVEGEMYIQVDDKASINIGNDISICGRSHILSSTSETPTATYSWSSNSGTFDDPTLLNPTFSGTNTINEESYTLTLVASNGACIDDDAITQTVDITLKGSPNGNITENDEAFCAPKDLDIEISFEGGNDYSYQLINNAGEIYGDSSNTDVTTKTINTTGTDSYKLYSLIDNTNGCYAAPENLIGVKNFTNEVPPTFAGDDKTTCGEGKQTVLEGSTNIGTTGVWSSSSAEISFTDINDSNSEVSSTNYMESELTWTETSTNLGCVNSSVVKVLFAESPTVTLSSTQDRICETNSLIVPIAITGNSPWVLNYNNNFETFTETISNPNHTIIIVGEEQLIGTNNYSFTNIIDVNGCETTYSDKTIDVIVDEMPFVIAGEDQTTCGKDVELQAIESGIATSVGVWQGIGTFDEPGSPNTTFTSLNFGEQTLTWIEVNGVCISNDQVSINFLEAPFPVNAGNDTIIYATTSMKLNADTLESGSGKWEVITGNAIISDPYDPKSSITNLMEGNNILSWTGYLTNYTVCESIVDELSITVHEIFAPTGISPNGDGLNDVLEILGAENINNNKLSVFNKHGKLVYQQKNYSNDWAGYDTGGSKLKADTYYYTFEGDQLTKPIKKFLIIKDIN